MTSAYCACFDRARPPTPPAYTYTYSHTHTHTHRQTWPSTVSGATPLGSGLFGKFQGHLKTRRFPPQSPSHVRPADAKCVGEDDLPRPTAGRHPKLRGVRLCGDAGGPSSFWRLGAGFLLVALKGTQRDQHFRVVYSQTPGL